MMAAASGEPAQTVVGAGPEPGGGSGRTRWEETGDGNIRKPHNTALREALSESTGLHR